MNIDEAKSNYAIAKEYYLSIADSATSAELYEVSQKVKSAMNDLIALVVEVQRLVV